MRASTLLVGILASLAAAAATPNNNNQGGAQMKNGGGGNPQGGKSSGSGSTIDAFCQCTGGNNAKTATNKACQDLWHASEVSGKCLNNGITGASAGQFAAKCKAQGATGGKCCGTSTSSCKTA